MGRRAGAGLRGRGWLRAALGGVLGGVLALVVVVGANLVLDACPGQSGGSHPVPPSVGVHKP